FYITTIDKQIKRQNHNPTIGVLLCKTPNKTVVEYSIKDINKPLGVADYEFKKTLPTELKSGMPTAKELEEELEKDIEIQKHTIDEKLEKLKTIIDSSTKSKK
ncbi:MAG: DUF1016 domain-containing protein, partial [Bacteroidales bacterium]|nr:DUF1016 domain-containing protein [Bacteroidales bacterium]